MSAWSVTLLTPRLAGLALVNTCGSTCGATSKAFMRLDAFPATNVGALSSLTALRLWPPRTPRCRPKKSLNQYPRQAHAENCDCSVCWLNRGWIPPKAPSCPYTPSTPRRPVRWSGVNGQPQVTPAYTCEKHKPGRRPPQCWHVVSDTGKPTPFVPPREPFELVGLLNDDFIARTPLSGRPALVVVSALPDRRFARRLLYQPRTHRDS